MKRTDRNKIRRKASDFYSTKDVAVDDERLSPINLTIENFDNCGHILNPPTPCVATGIDPAFKKDGDQRQRFRKFMVKSDIIKLRDITRTKFFLYTNRELALEKEREKQKNHQIYADLMRFYEFCFERLNTVERDSFVTMQQKYAELTELRNNRKLLNEKNKLEMRQQKIYTNISAIYQKFLYRLKLIEYFDHVTETSDEISKFNRIINDEKMTSLLAVIPRQHGRNEAENLTDLMERLIRPYLNQKSYMDARIWQKGYQAMRRKMFIYNRHLTRVALLNHFTAIIHDKFMKNHLFRLSGKKFERDAEFLRSRTRSLRNSAVEIFDNWENEEKADNLKRWIDGILPAMVRKLGLNENLIEIFRADDKSTITKLEQIQNHLMNLLYELDTYSPDLRHQIEKDVRDRTATEQAASKQALVKQNRFKNLLTHYRTHYAKKNIVCEYRTLLPRPKVTPKIKKAERISSK